MTDFLSASQSSWVTTASLEDPAELALSVATQPIGPATSETNVQLTSFPEVAITSVRYASCPPDQPEAVRAFAPVITAPLPLPPVSVRHTNNSEGISSSALANPIQPLNIDKALEPTRSLSAPAAAANLAAGLATERAKPVPENAMNQFRALFSRTQQGCTKYNALDFYADVRLTPVRLNKSVYQVVTTQPGLKAHNLDWKYTFISNGKRSHQWSLVKALADNDCKPARPLAVLETWGSGIKSYQAQISDFHKPVKARAFKMGHFWDSFRNEGLHVGFQLDSDYRFEWKRDGIQDHYGEDSLYLWRINLIDNQVTPVARILEKSLFQSPIDDADLWSLEVDRDGITEHLALVSAFYLKICRVKQHALFAPRKLTIEPATLLSSFAFGDDGEVYHNEDAHWYEGTSPKETASKSTPQSPGVRVVEVLSGPHLAQYRLLNPVIVTLETEMRRRVELSRAQLSI